MASYHIGVISGEYGEALSNLPHPLRNCGFGEQPAVNPKRNLYAQISAFWKVSVPNYSAPGGWLRVNNQMDTTVDGILQFNVNDLGAITCAYVAGLTVIANANSFRAEVMPARSFVRGIYYFRFFGSGTYTAYDQFGNAYTSENGFWVLHSAPLPCYEYIMRMKGWANPCVTTSTAAATAAKTADMSCAYPVNGSTFYWYLSVANTASSPSLNINNTGAKALYTAAGAQITTNGSCLVKGLYQLYYNGSQYWIISGPPAYLKAIHG